jgi:hypothetical protein
VCQHTAFEVTFTNTGMTVETFDKDGNRRFTGGSHLKDLAYQH